MAEIHCRHFNGYKPCGKGASCHRRFCNSYESVHHRLLIVHLEALGAVLRSTSILKAVKREFPKSHVTWITRAPAHQLLANLPEIDRILTVTAEDLIKLSVFKFDLAFVIDKSLVAAGLLNTANVAEVRGFRADALSGGIVPANASATELWELGLSDQKKFFENVKSEQRLVHEALDLGVYTRDEYRIVLSGEERALARSRKLAWSPSGQPVIGLNTGCSAILPAKKLSYEGTRDLIRRILADARFKGCPVVLLGGAEDKERNEALARELPVISSPTGLGLRDGLVSVEACDLVFSGDSLGMHMAIGLGKWVVAWFGPTCAQEIDLYDRGRKIMAGVSCSPCWKRVCQKAVMCYDRVDFNEVLDALAQGLSWHTSSSKRPFPEISSSLSL
ncbi:MAG: glycosyltransferase family 9 protein [Calothrix sp. SM1_5_4]|nr:glycosyltransferase family 9 protein [Calothrix sp. SM1_5_4]